MQQGFWSVWRVLAWLVPIGLIFVKTFSGTGSSETLVLWFGSPIIVPSVALFTVLPHYFLKSRGFGATPAPVIAMMTAFWMALTMTIIALPSAESSSSRSDSMLLQGFRVSKELGADFFRFSALCVGISYFGALICAAVSHPGAPPEISSNEDLMAQSRANRAAVIGVICALIGTPVLAAAPAWWMEYGRMHGSADAGGNREIDVFWLSSDETRQLQESRWNEAQRMLVPIREGIAKNGWRDTTAQAITPKYEYSSNSRYQVYVTWENYAPDKYTAVFDDSDPAAADTARELANSEITKLLASYGWTPVVAEKGEDEPCKGSAEEGRVCVKVENASGWALLVGTDKGIDWDVEDDANSDWPLDAPYFYLTLRSPWYWYEGSDAKWCQLYRRLHGYGEESLNKYRFDQWPELLETDVTC